MQMVRALLLRLAGDPLSPHHPAAVQGATAQCQHLLAVKHDLRRKCVADLLLLDLSKGIFRIGLIAFNA
jgi:hypothetical protein